jgi:membrane protein DedA with SNARE-associated domain
MGSMLEAFVTWLTDLVFELGYLGIVLLMAVESSAIPFPSEVVMPPAGSNVALGRMHFGLVVLAGTLGSLLGALTNYAIARWLDRWLRQHGRWLLVRAGSLDRAEAFFRRHGEISTFIGRLVPVVRQLISIPAGLARMPLHRFAGYTALGAGIWCVILTWIGWAIGRHAGVLRQEEVQQRVWEVLWYLLPLLALIALGYAWWYRRRRRGAGTPAAGAPR